MLCAHIGCGSSVVPEVSENQSPREIVAKLSVHTDCWACTLPGTVIRTSVSRYSHLVCIKGGKYFLNETVVSEHPPVLSPSYLTVLTVLFLPCEAGTGFNSVTALSSPTTTSNLVHKLIPLRLAPSL